MNKKLFGIIFIIFGVGLFSGSIHELYGNPLHLNYDTVKSILLVLLGLSSVIYGYTQLKVKNNH